MSSVTLVSNTKTSYGIAAKAHPFFHFCIGNCDWLDPTANWAITNPIFLSSVVAVSFSVACRSRCLAVSNGQWLVTADKLTGQSTVNSNHSTKQTSQSVVGSSHSTKLTGRSVVSSNHSTKLTSQSVVSSKHSTKLTGQSVVSPTTAPNWLANQWSSPTTAPNWLANQWSSPTTAPNWLANQWSAPTTAPNWLANQWSAPTTAPNWPAYQQLAPTTSPHWLSNQPQPHLSAPTTAPHWLVSQWSAWATLIRLNMSCWILVKNKIKALWCLGNVLSKLKLLCPATLTCVNNWLYLSRHCLPVRPLRCLEMRVQRFGPYSCTRWITLLSSCHTTQNHPLAIVLLWS